MPRVPFKPLQFHHLYWGLLWLCFAAYLLLAGRWPEPLGWGILWNLLLAITTWLALIVTVCDINQHWGTGNDPAHRLFVRWWDAVFGDWWPFGSL